MLDMVTMVTAGQESPYSSDLIVCGVTTELTANTTPILQQMLTMDDLVDNLIEDEAEKASLLAKPTCFIIVGKPGVGKSTLAQKLAESWKCILIDDTDLLNTHINSQTEEGNELLRVLSEGRSVPDDLVLELIHAKLSSPDVEHYGYVLSCLPFMSEGCQKIHEQIEQIKNHKLAPDVIINIKCADEDLVQRLSGLRQHPETGQLYNRDQWKYDNVYNKKEEDEDQNSEVNEEQAEANELPRDIIDQMVWIPEHSATNACAHINTFKDNVLRPLQKYMADHNPLYLLELNGNNTPEELVVSVMSHLGSMAIKHVSVPIPLSQPDDEDSLEDVDTEDLLRFMSSRTVVPGFRWRKSRWGQMCPVALKEGKVINGKPEFSVGFQDKLYILSSQKAHQKFITNPRRYLLPPMPRMPCKVSIVGPSRSGKSTVCTLLAQHCGAVVLDMEQLMQPVLQERLDKVKRETTADAIENVKLKSELDGAPNTVTDDHPEVQAIVLSAVEEAKQMNSSSFELHAEELQKQVEELDSDVEDNTGWVLDNFPKNLSQMEALRQVGIKPSVVVCLRDSDGHNVLRRLYETNKKNIDVAVEKRLQEEQSHDEKQVLPLNKQPEARSNLETVVEDTDEDPENSDATITMHPDKIGKEDVALQHHWQLGCPEGPEMDEYKVQLQQFVAEWAEMADALNVPYCVLEIGSKSPDDLVQEILQELQKTFKYLPTEVSAADLEEEDMEALAELEEEEEELSNDSYAAEDDEEDTSVKRLLGDTYHFCPVVLKSHNTLWPCTDEIAAKYREKTYYFSSQDARDSFLQNPTQFVAQTGPLKPPALRIFLLGARGSGKTAHGEQLARQLGLFHIQFREQLQMLIIAKTKKRVPHADELVSLEDSSDDLEELINEARGEGEKETEEAPPNGTEEEVLTDEELSIKAYLSGEEALDPQVLDVVIAPFWQQEPYRSTGFILEGFPHDAAQVQYMLQRQLFPDAVVVMEVDVSDAQQRLLPTYLENWRERRSLREAKLDLLRDLRKKKREEDISRRRAELVAERAVKEEKNKINDEEDEESDGAEEEEPADSTEDEIEAILEEEFPLEEDDEDLDNGDTEDTATERLEMEIEERFETDTQNQVTVTELLTKQNIPVLTIEVSCKHQISQQRLRKKIQQLLTNRESLFQKCQPISPNLATKLLLSSYKLHSAFGCYDPVKQYQERDLIQPLLWPLSASYPLIFHHFIYFFASKENRKTFMLNPLKYLQQHKPTTSFPIKLSVIGPRKSGKTTVAQTLAQKYGVARLSIGEAMRMVLTTQGHTNLAAQLKTNLTKGLVVPDELAVQCLEVVLMSSVCSSRGYVLDGFPMTLKQAELMESLSIIPMLVVELELDTVETARRGHADKMKPDKPHLMLDSPEIFHLCDSIYKNEVVQVRKHFQEQHQNYVLLDGLKSKWWIWDRIVKDVSIRVKYVYTYVERTQSGQAACINRLCITPKDFECRLGEFGQYCPVCLALHQQLLDCSETAALTHAAVYKGRYYKMCDKYHLERFLSTPDQYVAPGCPHSLPEAPLLPSRLTEIQVKDKFPQQAALKGFCPVTYLDGKQSYEALVRGKLEYAVDYRERIYVCETKQKQDKFLRTPEIYWDQKLPNKVPPLDEPVPITALPIQGYLEQSVAVPLIKAMTAAGCLRPKYPFLSVQRSVLLYVALYLKAFNQKSTDYTRQRYKKKVASFEEDCALIPYLSLVMRQKYRPSSELPIDFQFKLNKFLALGENCREPAACCSPVGVSLMTTL